MTPIPSFTSVYGVYNKTEQQKEKSKTYGIELRQSILDPLGEYLDKCWISGDRNRRLFIAPDSELTRLVFEVLPFEDGSCLIDYYYISYVNTCRDILRFNADRTESISAEYIHPPLVAADPDFNLGCESRRHKPIVTIDTSKSVRSPYNTSESLKQYFPRLKETRKEGKIIAQMLGVDPLLGKSVLEGKIRSRTSPHIIHFATHGFFIPRDPRDPIYRKAEDQPLRGSRDLFSSQKNDNPMVRSGLALASANAKFLNSNQSSRILPKEAEDGIMTAGDVARWDLTYTELVVLSACETGLGEVYSGEGVFGLRRSFVLAGAQTLIMSLWKVPDGVTRELMIDFYENLLIGLSREEALRKAQMYIRGLYPDPFYWGAFILLGDIGPLKYLTHRTCPKGHEIIGGGEGLLWCTEGTRNCYHEVTRHFGRAHKFVKRSSDDICPFCDIGKGS